MAPVHRGFPMTAEWKDSSGVTVMSIIWMARMHVNCRGKELQLAGTGVLRSTANS